MSHEVWNQESDRLTVGASCFYKAAEEWGRLMKIGKPTQVMVKHVETGTTVAYEVTSAPSVAYTAERVK